MIVIYGNQCKAGRYKKEFVECVVQFNSVKSGKIDGLMCNVYVN